MQENRFKAELGFFESLKTRISSALHEYSRYGNKWKFVNIAKRLWEKYNHTYYHTNDLLGFEIYISMAYFFFNFTCSFLFHL